MKKQSYKYLVGIDEVGRGPLAGGVAVGLVCIPHKHQKRVSRLFPVVKDSKKLSAKKRNEWFLKINKAKENGWLEYSVAFVPPSFIDKNGIVKAIRKSIEQSFCIIEKYDLDNIKVLLDGGLKAPVRCKNQKTIIKGDEKELVIALASIVAKVKRDAQMTTLAKKFPLYGFEKHKGYGTHFHYEALKKYGITKHHRKSFCHLSLNNVL